MRHFIVAAQFSLMLPIASAQSAPAGWKLIRDSKGACQIAVPEDWTPSENPGSAIFQDTATAIAVITSQPGQSLKPLAESLQKLLRIPKEKMFENTARRVYYQEKIARDAKDSNAFIAVLPGQPGPPSSRALLLPTLS